MMSHRRMRMMMRMMMRRLRHMMMIMMRMKSGRNVVSISGGRSCSQVMRVMMMRLLRVVIATEMSGRHR